MVTMRAARADPSLKPSFHLLRLNSIAIHNTGFVLSAFRPTATLCSIGFLPLSWSIEVVPERMRPLRLGYMGSKHSVVEQAPGQELQRQVINAPFSRAEGLLLRLVPAVGDAVAYAER